jgi:hypothetical protein
MEDLLKALPSTLYDEQWETNLWLTLTATTEGDWQAGYQNIDGLMHDNLFAESKSPLTAVTRLRAKTILNTREKGRK